MLGKWVFLIEHWELLVLRTFTVSFKVAVPILGATCPTSLSGNKLCTGTTMCGQWRTQKFFMGGVCSVVYGGHLHLVCALCDVTI